MLGYHFGRNYSSARENERVNSPFSLSSRADDRCGSRASRHAASALRCERQPRRTTGRRRAGCLAMLPPSTGCPNAREIEIWPRKRERVTCIRAGINRDEREILCSRLKMNGEFFSRIKCVCVYAIRNDKYAYLFVLRLILNGILLGPSNVRIIERFIVETTMDIFFPFRAISSQSAQDVLVVPP